MAQGRKMLVGGLIALLSLMSSFGSVSGYLNNRSPFNETQAVLQAQAHFDNFGNNFEMDLELFICQQTNTCGQNLHNRNATYPAPPQPYEYLFHNVTKVIPEPRPVSRPPYDKAFNATVDYTRLAYLRNPIWKSSVSLMQMHQGRYVTDITETCVVPRQYLKPVILRAIWPLNAKAKPALPQSKNDIGRLPEADPESYHADLTDHDELIKLTLKAKESLLKVAAQTPVNRTYLQKMWKAYKTVMRGKNIVGAKRYFDISASPQLLKLATALDPQDKVRNSKLVFKEGNRCVFYAQYFGRYKIIFSLTMQGKGNEIDAHISKI